MRDTGIGSGAGGLDLGIEDLRIGDHKFGGQSAAFKIGGGAAQHLEFVIQRRIIKRNIANLQPAGFGPVQKADAFMAEI